MKTSRLDLHLEVADAGLVPRSSPGHATDACLVVVAITWGSSYLAAKDATGLVSADAVLFLRYAVAAVACLMLVAVLTVWHRQPVLTAREGRIGALLGVTQAAVLYLETHGVAHTSAAAAGVLISLTIILTPLLGAAAGTRVPARLHAAAGVCVAGVAIMLGTRLGPDGWFGDLLILAAALLRAGHVTLIGRLAPRGDQPPLRPLRLTLVQLLVGTVLSAPLAIGQLASAPAALRAPELVGAILFLALGCSVFAFLVQTWAVHRTSANRASLLLGTEPLWALAAAVALGGERLGIRAVLGALVIIAGCWWGQAIERRARAAASPTTPSPATHGPTTPSPAATDATTHPQPIG